MAKPFKTLTDKMSPEAQARVKERVEKALEQLKLPIPRADRDFDPKTYDVMWQQGRSAALTGQPRRAPGFQYGYEADCWFDGYDDVKNVPVEV